MVTPEATDRTCTRNDDEYWPRTARVLTDPTASSSSAERLPATMNSEPKQATIRNQSDSSTPVAAAPATARITKPAATAARSTTAMCFSQMVYVVVSTT